MKFEREILPGAWVIRPRTHADHRGQFVKTYARSLLVGQGVSFDFAEEFYSISGRHVVRGMHLQLPPHDHVKMVYCVAGVARDVLLDLRKGPGYGRVAEVDLTADEPAVLLIPSGVAHGFAALEDHTLLIYKTSSEHAPQADTGVRWDSFGHDWRLGGAVTLSERDATLPGFAEFVSPF